jgi:outer membrane protein assembly factor BamB
MLRLLAAVLLCACVLSCGGESGPNGIDIGSIVVTPNPVSLAQQASVQLQVAVLDDAGALLTGVPVTFVSGSTSLVTVSNTGMVQSVGPAGSSTITVRAGNMPLQVPVSVSATGNTIRVLPAPAVVAQLQTLQLDVALLDLVGSEIPGTSFTFGSSDESIATVSATGLVHAIGRSGQVTITATTVGLPAGNLSAQIQLAVTQVPTSLELLPGTVSMGKSSTMPVAARVLDAYGEAIPGAQITFSASPASLFSVSASGILTGNGSVGSGTLTATSGALTAVVPVTLIEMSSLAGTIVTTAPALGGPYGVALKADGSVLGIGVGGMLHVGSFGSTTVRSYQISGEVTVGIAVDQASGRTYVAGAGEDALMEVDPASGAVLRRWSAPGEQMFDVAVAPNGQQLYVGGNSGKLYAIAAATMTEAWHITVPIAVIHLIAHPTQPVVYASGDGGALEVNVDTRATRQFELPSAQASALAVAGGRLFLASEDGSVGVIDLASGAVQVVAVPSCRIYDVVAAPDGLALLATCSIGSTAVLLDAVTLAVLKTIETGGTPRRAAIRADGTGAVIANEAGWYDHIQ